jgi:hypothetical protein
MDEPSNNNCKPLGLNCGRAIMYADDTSILNMGRNLDELGIATSDNISKVIQYFEANKSE